MMTLMARHTSSMDTSGQCSIARLSWPLSPFPRAWTCGITVLFPILIRLKRKWEAAGPFKTTCWKLYVKVLQSICFLNCTRESLPPPVKVTFWAKRCSGADRFHYFIIWVASGCGKGGNQTAFTKRCFQLKKKKTENVVGLLSYEFIVF